MVRDLVGTVMTDKPLPARVLRYDGKTPDSEAGAVRCMECRTILKPEQFDDGYCDEICARTAMMKRTKV